MWIASPPAPEVLPLTRRFWMMMLLLPLMLMPPLIVALVPTPISVLLEFTLSSLTDRVPEMRMIWRVLLSAADCNADAELTSTVLPPWPPVVVARPRPLTDAQPISPPVVTGVHMELAQLPL